jgi:hypothetical protein
MMQAYVERRRERRWDTFLRTEWLVLAGEDENGEEETVQTHIWAKDLVYDKLEPLLRRNGYIFSCTTADFLNCLLNYMYRHIQDSRAMEATTYMCRHAHECRQARMVKDAEEHFHSRKFPPAVWEQVRRRVRVEEWSDESDFAARFWTDLPHIVFAHIDCVQSNAMNELVDWVNNEDEEEESTTSKKKEIDPYLLDYYGAKYKKYDE